MTETRDGIKELRGLAKIKGIRPLTKAEGTFEDIGGPLYPGLFRKGATMTLEDYGQQAYEWGLLKDGYSLTNVAGLFRGPVKYKVDYGEDWRIQEESRADDTDADALFAKRSVAAHKAWATRRLQCLTC